MPRVDLVAIADVHLVADPKQCARWSGAPGISGIIALAGQAVGQSDSPDVFQAKAEMFVKAIMGGDQPTAETKVALTKWKENVAMRSDQIKKIFRRAGDPSCF